MGHTVSSYFGTHKRIDLRTESSPASSGLPWVGLDAEFVPDKSYNGVTTDVILLAPSIHTTSKENRQEIIAHEFFHGYVKGYNPVLFSLINNTGLAFEEGIADLLSVLWSRASNTATNWVPFGQANRNISSPMAWTDPIQGTSDGGRVFSNLFYRIQSYGFPGVDETRAMRLAMDLARTVLPNTAPPNNQFTIADISARLNQLTAGDANLRNATCKAWVDMGFPNNFCIPTNVTLSKNFLGCAYVWSVLASVYQLQWTSGGNNATYYNLQLYNPTDGWYTLSNPTVQFSTIGVYLITDSWARVRSCNSAVCSGYSNEVHIPYFCGN